MIVKLPENTGSAKQVRAKNKFILTEDDLVANDDTMTRKYTFTAEGDVFINLFPTEWVFTVGECEATVAPNEPK